MKSLRMTYLFSCVLLLVSLVGFAQSEGTGSNADREQILQLERDWTQSWVTMDVAANERILADDFFGTEPDGKRVRKADLIAELKSGEAPLASNHLDKDDLTIRF